MKHGVAGTTQGRVRSALLYATPAVLLISIAGGCVQRSYNSDVRATPDSAKTLIARSAGQQSEAQSPPLININTASADELEKLPGIGKALAARIIEHREKFGPFRKPEHLIIVRGISDKRFRALQNLITIE